MGKRGVGKEMRWMCDDAWGGGLGNTWRFGWSMGREGTHYGGVCGTDVKDIFCSIGWAYKVGGRKVKFDTLLAV
jgi:hypothetical protein